MKFSMNATNAVILLIVGATTTDALSSNPPFESRTLTVAQTSTSLSGFLSRFRRKKRIPEIINGSGMPSLEIPTEPEPNVNPTSHVNTTPTTPFSFEPKRTYSLTKYTSPGVSNAYPKTHKDIDNILTANREWVSHRLQSNPQFFQTTSAVHKPQYLWIGCADARVPANEIMGEDAGSVFVIRNVANLVCSTDFNVMSALQYGVNVLNIPHIIVCGHYDCGGVRASMEDRDHLPPLENWLRNIRDVYRLHRVELNAIKDAEARHRRLVELNVIEQCINLFKTGVVQRHRIDTYADPVLPFSTPRIHPCVYDPKDGLLKELKVDFKSYLSEFRDIYDLYHLDDDVKEQLRTQKMTTNDVLARPAGPSSH